MRTRLTLLLIAIAAMTGFALLNWSELVRPVQLSWGWRVGEAPLGLILLAVLVLSWVGFLIGSAYLETRYQLASHRSSKVLEAQRTLADKAEASRFTELRTYLESQAAVAVQREAALAARLENMVRTEHGEVVAHIDRLSAKLALYSGDMAARAVGLRRDGPAPH